MTQAAQTPAVQSFSFDGKELPFEFPRCSRVLTDNPLPADKPESVGHPLLWMQGEQHPMIETHMIVRMYVMPGVGIEVYSVERPKDGVKGAVRGGARQTIPWPHVRMAEEVMDLATFVGEIETAEKGDDGGGDEPEPAPGPNGAAAVAGNGSAAAS